MRNEISHTACPFFVTYSEKYPVDPSVLAFLLEKAQTSPSLSVRRFETSKFMRSSLTQTGVFQFFLFGFFDAVS